MFNKNVLSLKWNPLLNNMTAIPAKGRKRVRENLWYLKLAIWKTATQIYSIHSPGTQTLYVS